MNENLFICEQCLKQFKRTNLAQITQLRFTQCSHCASYFICIEISKTLYNFITGKEEA